MGLYAGNLGLERLDPRLQLVDRKGSKVLFDEQCQWVLRLAGKEVILVHS